jgi:hypothetical protein
MISTNRKIMVTERKVIAMLAALERMKLYCAAHPASPAATHQPRLFKRDERWVAILGISSNQTICGIGSTVETALRAFDENYLSTSRSSPPKRPRDAGSGD